MKKILFTVCFMLGIACMSMAQSTTQKAPVAAPLEKKAATPKAGKHLKKDGTADMRFKENKVATEEIRLKKDGTPDKRFKRSKTKKG